MFLYLFVFILSFHKLNAFNFDTQYPIVKHGTRSSYFGYSLALHHSSNERTILIGAPLADTPQIKQAGAVFKCPLNHTACSQLLLDKRGEQMQHDKKTESKQGQWLGASISTSPSGALMACAPRYVHYSINLKRREPVGICYLASSLNAEPVEFSPCKVKEKWGYHRLGSCQAGFASAISRSGATFYLTAPGSFYWQGQVYSFDALTSEYIATRDSKPENDDTYMGYSIAAGKFSVSRSSDSLDLAVGIPKGNPNLSGKVLLLDADLRPLGSLVGESLGSYFGYAIAALDADGDGRLDLAVGAPMFTHTAANQPLEYEQGRVYIFYQRSPGLFSRMQPLDVLSHSRARFGAALASLGDQLGDGAHSLAVGAPYDGAQARGCVYIFHATKADGLLYKKPAQVLTAEQFTASLPPSSPANLRTFGFSLASGADVTDDALQDLAIGAYASDTVVFLKSRPIVHARPVLRIFPESVSLDNKNCSIPTVLSSIDHSSSSNGRTWVSCVQIQFCIGFDGARAISNELAFRWNATLDASQTDRKPRMLLLSTNSVASKPNSAPVSTHQGVLTISKGSKGKCATFNAYISEMLRDKLNPIQVALHYELVPTVDDARTAPPVLNAYVPQLLSRNVTIQKNCGADSVCIPDLQLSVRSSLSEYVLGANEKLRLTLHVQNAGEDAFEATLRMLLPPDIHLVQVIPAPGSSTATWQEFGANAYRERSLLFDLGNPLPAGRFVKLVVEFAAMQTLTTSSSNYAFSFALNTSNPEAANTYSDNVLNLTIPLRVNVTLEPFGQSYVAGLPQALIHNVSAPLTHMDKKNVYQQVKHAYFLKNQGPSHVKEMSVTILWPEKSIEGNSLFELIAQPRVRITDITNRLSASCSDIFLEVEMPIQSRPVEETIPADPINYHRSLLTSNYSLAKVRTRRNIGEEEEEVTSSYSTSSVSDLNCDESRCRKIHCTVHDMPENSGVTFEVYARPWNTTLREIGFAEFSVTSIAVARIRRLQYNVDPSFLPPTAIKVTTTINLVGLESSSVIPLWIIVLAICFGLLILLLIVVCLWKLGFFVRKRPPTSSMTSHNSSADTQLLSEPFYYAYRKPGKSDR